MQNFSGLSGLGRTSQNKYVYIFSNQDLKIWNELTLNTWGYFVSSSPNIKTYKIICFEGGILNKLFSPSSVCFEYTDGLEIKGKYQDDCQTYPLLNKKSKGIFLFTQILMNEEQLRMAI